MSEQRLPDSPEAAALRSSVSASLAAVRVHLVALRAGPNTTDLLSLRKAADTTSDAAKRLIKIGGVGGASTPQSAVSAERPTSAQVLAQAGIILRALRAGFHGSQCPTCGGAVPPPTAE